MSIEDAVKQLIKWKVFYKKGNFKKTNELTCIVEIGNLEYYIANYARIGK